MTDNTWVLEGLKLIKPETALVASILVVILADLTLQEGGGVLHAARPRLPAWLTAPAPLAGSVRRHAPLRSDPHGRLPGRLRDRRLRELLQARCSRRLPRGRDLLHPGDQGLDLGKGRVLHAAALVHLRHDADGGRERPADDVPVAGVRVDHELHHGRLPAEEPEERRSVAEVHHLRRRRERLHDLRHDVPLRPDGQPERRGDRRPIAKNPRRRP